MDFVSILKLPGNGVEVLVFSPLEIIITVLHVFTRSFLPSGLSLRCSTHQLVQIFGTVTALAILVED